MIYVIVYVALVLLYILIDFVYKKIAKKSLPTMALGIFWLVATAIASVWLPWYLICVVFTAFCLAAKVIIDRRRAYLSKKFAKDLSDIVGTEYKEEDFAQ